MPSNKPRVTLYFEKQEMETLEAWAGQEFLTVPQLTRVVVKRAIAEYLKQHPLESVTDADSDRPADPQPTEPEPAPKTTAAAKAATAKAKGGRGKS